VLARLVACVLSPHVVATLPEIGGRRKAEVSADGLVCRRAIARPDSVIVSL
jgi:hypothetical protein